MSQKKKLSYVSKIIIGVSAFLLLMDAAFGAILATHSINKMRVIIQSKITELSATAANLLNGDDIKSLTYADYENETPKYKESYDILKAFKTSAIDAKAALAYIYCMVKLDDGTIVFSVDPSDDPAEFLSGDDVIITDGLTKAFNGETAFDTESYVDRWGDLYSAYSPIFGSDNTVKAIVGVDVWASWYKQELSSSAIAIGVFTLVTMLLGAGITFIVTNKLRKRVAILEEEMNDLEGDVKELIKEISDPKYVSIKQDNNEQGLARIREQIKLTSAEIKNYIVYTRKQAFTDALTSLGNRNAYFELVHSLDEKILNKEDINFGVLLFDINGLKEINDTFGHVFGDKAITLSGTFIKEAFGQETSFRIGGDELVAICFDMSEKDIKDKLNEIGNKIKNNNNEHPESFHLTVSYGYAFYDKDKDKKYNDVFKKADQDMYLAKKRYYKEKGVKIR